MKNRYLIYRSKATDTALTIKNILVLLLFTVIAILYANSTTPVVYAADCSLGTITVTQESFHEVVVDEPGLDSTYVAYEIVTGASDSFDDLWVRLENFSDLTKISPATNEDGLYHVGPMANNESKFVYFYVNASATAVAQTYDLNLFEGNPSFGVSTCTHTASHDLVGDEIQAAANKVTSVVSTAPYIGGTMTITVTGETGSMSSSRPEGSVFVMTPASVDAWPADCYELYATEITFSGGNTGTYYNALVVTGLNSPNSSYTAIYSFKATCSTLTPTSVTPVNYISSGGTNLKHTDTSTSTYTSIPPVPPAENRIVMTKSVSPGGSAGGGVATYTLRFTNTAPIAVTIDTIEDTLAASPDNTFYVATSTNFDAVAQPDPNIAGQVLTWGGAFIVPANSSKDFTYDVNVPGTNGEYVNSAVAFVGNTQIDQTIDTTDNTPASASYGVGDPNLTSSTKTVSDLNGGNVEPGDILRYTISMINSGSLDATGVDVSDAIDTDTENLTNVVVAANASSCGSSHTNSSTATNLSIIDIDVASGGNCDITFDVAVKASTSDNTDILNTAIIGGANEGGVGGSPTSTPLSVQLVPSLSVTKTENDADNFVLASEVIPYTVTISNNGETNATGVDLSDSITGPVSLVDNFTFTNCGSVYSNASTGLSIQVANVDVAIGVDCVITYDVTIDAGATSGQTVDNVADISVANEGGNDPSIVNATTLTVGAPALPDLSVTTTENDVDDIVTPGQTITYTVTISNSGAATGTTSFTDTIDSDYGTPFSFAYTNCGGGEGSSFSAPTLTMSNLVVTTSNDCVVTYQVTVDNPSTEGTTLTNSVDVAQSSEGGNDPVAVNATTLSIDVTPNLSTSTKTENVASDTVTPGQTFTYTMTLINTGDGLATGVDISDTLDSDITALPGTISFSNCGSSYNDTTSSTAINITNLEISVVSNCIISIDVTVDNPLDETATITNTATIGVPTEGGVGASPSATTLSVNATPSLSVTKTENDADNTVEPNQTVTYTVTISNNGDGTATGVSITDSITGPVSSVDTITLSNCGGIYSNTSTGLLITVSNLTISTTSDCVLTYDATISSSANDGQTITNEADVTVSNEGGNNPDVVTATSLTVDDGAPVAVNDSATVDEDSASNSIDWDDSDTLTDNATLDSFDATSTQGGVVSDNGNGTFNYTPPSGFSGSDGFNYTICDDDTPTAHCDSATISITVVDQGSPSANDDSVTLTSKDTATISWDDNDLLTDNATLDSFDATSTQGGVVSDNGNGTFNYTPPSGFSGSDGFNYTICDDDTPTPACSSATMSIEVDVDIDGISDTVEGEGPNNGDANGDGTPDNTQSHVASLPNPENDQAYVSLESDDPTCGVVQNFGVINEESLEVQNEKYDFPIGLFDFTINCTNPGDSTTITFYLDKIYDTSKWVYIKYDGSVLQYADLPGVSFSTANVGGQTVTTINYLATDGDFVDEDKLLNGTIVDPSGPAVLAEESVLVDTGQSSINNVLVGLFIISMSGILLLQSQKNSS